MKIAYKPKAFRASSLGIIEVANRIIESYAEQGFDLIVRQLYYQFIAQDLFPDEWFDEKAGSKNSERNYKRLGKVVNDARLAGLVHWETLVDRTRPVVRTPTWENPADVIRSAHESFRIDFWEDQPHYVEVWVEKEALMGVVGRACSEWRVPHLACRGYTSQSAQWRSAQRMVEATDRGKTVTVLHLGDHDPSGIDMTRDNEERLWLLSGGADIQVHRLALNVPQVERYQPPPNPTKLSDTRARGYIERFGMESWELDALDPQTIVDLIDEAIKSRIDGVAWSESETTEDRHRENLKAASDRWDEVTEFLSCQ